MSLWISWGDSAQEQGRRSLQSTVQKTYRTFNLCTKPWDGAVDNLFTLAYTARLARLTASCLFFDQLF